MSGRLVARGHIYPDPETVTAIEAQIPDGYDVQVATTPDWWLLYLIADNGRVAGPLRVSRGTTLLYACRFAIEHWQKAAA